jgi:hypothetical protein
MQQPIEREQRETLGPTRGGWQTRDVVRFETALGDSCGGPSACPYDECRLELHAPMIAPVELRRERSAAGDVRFRANATDMPLVALVAQV